MIRYNSLHLLESYPQREIVNICRFLKKSYAMKFVVIGGAAFTLYTGARANDLDIVVYDFGNLTENEVDRVIAKDHENNLVEIELLGVQISFLKPGQTYRKGGEALFSIPVHFYNTYMLQSIETVGLIDLMNMTKKKDRNFRYKALIRMFNLSEDFVHNLRHDAQEDFIVAYNEIQ